MEKRTFCFVISFIGTNDTLCVSVSPGCFQDYGAKAIAFYLFGRFAMVKSILCYSDWFDDEGVPVPICAYSSPCISYRLGMSSDEGITATPSDGMKTSDEGCETLIDFC